MSNYHFNINFRLKNKAYSRQILKLDNLKYTVTPSLKSKGIEHILIQRICDGKLKQNDLQNQILSRKYSQGELKKQKGFYYEDNHQVASVKEFFHFYKLASSEKNNMQRQDFNEQLSKKTEKIITILHSKDQSYKDKFQSQPEEYPIKSHNSLINQSSKDFFYSRTNFYQLNQHKNNNSTINFQKNTQLFNQEEDMEKGKHSIGQTSLKNDLLLQRKSSLKLNSQCKFIPIQNYTGGKNYFLSPVSSTKNMHKQDDFSITVPTSPNKFSIPSSQIRTIPSRLKSSINQGKMIKVEQSLMAQQIFHEVLAKENNIPNKQEKIIQSIRQNRVKELNLSDLSQNKQQGSTACNTGSRRFTSQIIQSPKYFQSECVPKINNLNTETMQNGLQSPPAIENSNKFQNSSTRFQCSSTGFQNSKIQQLINDFNDSVLEEDQNSIADHQVQAQTTDKTDLSKYMSMTQGTNFNQQTLPNETQRKNCIPFYFEVQRQNEKLRDSRRESKATVSFSLPQSEEKPNENYLTQQNTQNSNNNQNMKNQSRSMVNLQFISSQDSLASMPAGLRVRSYSPNKQNVSDFNDNYSNEVVPIEQNQNLKLKQFLTRRKQSLQFTMKHADKFLHSHDSLAGVKALQNNKDKKIIFLSQIFKNATNLDILISNQIDHSIERKKKQLLKSNSKQTSKLSNEFKHEKKKSNLNEMISFNDNIYSNDRNQQNDEDLFNKDNQNSQKNELNSFKKDQPDNFLESDFEVSSFNSVPMRVRESDNSVIQKIKRDISLKDNIEEKKENESQNNKKPFLVVSRLKQENLLDKSYNTKPILNIDKDISQNISKIDSLLSKKSCHNIDNDAKKQNSLSYTQKRFNTRAEVSKHFNIKNYFNIQKNISTDYSNAKKSIMLSSFDKKIYTKNSDFINLFH